MVGRVAARRSRKSVRSAMRRRRLKRSPLARIARQMLGADAVEGAVEPGLHIAEQDMDDGQHGIGVFAAVLDDRVVAEAVGEAVVALQTISDDAGARLGCAADK